MNPLSPISTDQNMIGAEESSSGVRALPVALLLGSGRELLGLACVLSACGSPDLNLQSVTPVRRDALSTNASLPFRSSPPLSSLQRSFSPSQVVLLGKTLSAGVAAQGRLYGLTVISTSSSRAVEMARSFLTATRTATPPCATPASLAAPPGDRRAQYAP